MIIKKYPLDHLKDDQITTIREVVRDIDGVHAVRVDTVSNTVTVEFENTADEKRISDTINQNTRHS